MVKRLTKSDPGAVDVHQHLWPMALIEALRGRTRAPRMVGWQLELDGERPYDVIPADHDVTARQELAGRDGLSQVLLSLSCPLGIEQLPESQAITLLDAWHEGVAELPAPFGSWAAAGLVEPDPGGLRKQLDRGRVGLQLPATALADPWCVENLGPLLAVLEEADRPLLVHPGPVAAHAPKRARATRTRTGATRAGAPRAAAAGFADTPGWWPALVPYVAQQHAAWFAWHAAGRANHPRLRVCFVALAGLAPLHHERLVARGGSFARVDPLVFFETSSYGAGGIDAALRVVGIDGLVHGTDRPYACPVDHGLGAAVTHALRVTNPHRLLHGEAA
ncbi:MAG TPA: amidohydrolase [Mycobacteriales bacterium]|nr:amidohydrolase [Mycobacteriales bacterium]